MIAREAGLEPLADRLFADPTLDPAAEAAAFINAEAGFADAHAVLDGVRDICSASAGPTTLPWWASCVNGCGPKRCCRASWPTARTATTPTGQVPRLLRLRRTDPHRAQPPGAGGVSRPHAGMVGRQAHPRRRDSPGSTWLGRGPHRASPGLEPRQAPKSDDLIRKTVAWTWKVKLSLSLERDLFSRLREEAETVAIKVFADNLRDLLLAAPAGKRVVMGLDPGIRTGVKVAVVSDTGKVLDTHTVYPHEPRCDWEGSLHTWAAWWPQHGVNLIAIGNGTASRETDKLAGDLIKRIAGLAPDFKLDKVVVSEAGASVYSASEFASKELPDLDVSLRGAVSIARRLQDPLAELVKIDPKSIGVGQYQHDVNQSGLARMPGRRGGRLRQRRGRGPQHRQRTAAGAGVGAERRRWPRQHRALA
jgi:uncharacterized protein